MNELVTVVIPIYNVEKYLRRCIESVINQTYSALEIILVDDGSPDNCPLICDEYAAKDSRIKVIHKENQGLGMARNTGIDNASGQYICFFDSDDYIEPDTVELCVAAAVENNAEMVVFGHDDVTPDEILLKEHIPSTPKQLFIGDEVKTELLPMSLSDNLKTGADWSLTLSAWNKLYSMDVIKKSGWRFVSEREILSEDFYSLTELHGYLNSVFVINRVLYHYTVNKASVSRSYKPDRFERIKHFYKSIDLLSEKMELKAVLEQPIKSITFGVTIGAMKQIVAADFKFKKRYRELKNVVLDECLQDIVTSTCYVGANKQKKLLYWCVKHKFAGLCFLLVFLKNKKEA